MLIMPKEKKYRHKSFLNLLKKLINKQVSKYFPITPPEHELKHTSKNHHFQRAAKTLPVTEQNPTAQSVKRIRNSNIKILEELQLRASMNFHRKRQKNIYKSTISL